MALDYYDLERAFVVSTLWLYLVMKCEFRWYFRSGYSFLLSELWLEHKFVMQKSDSEYPAIQTFLFKEQALSFNPHHIVNTLMAVFGCLWLLIPCHFCKLPSSSRCSYNLMHIIVSIQGGGTLPRAKNLIRENS